jgi:hypothetical protein
LLIPVGELPFQPGSIFYLELGGEKFLYLCPRLNHIIEIEFTGFLIELL